jgi:hypothetical protein
MLMQLERLKMDTSFQLLVTFKQSKLETIVPGGLCCL